uniref:Uncharacterized protein n=1 Tax=Rhizophora mucronata TaxID=61149 RepID=A0A2P2QPR1_RHIMU
MGYPFAHPKPKSILTNSRFITTLPLTVVSTNTSLYKCSSSHLFH